MLEISFDPFPILYTKRLTLRRVTKEDAKEIFLLRSDTTVMQYLDRPPAADINDAFQFIQRVEDNLANNDGINWCIALQGDDTLIGSIGFHRIEKEHYRAEIGYMLTSPFHRQGIMQEAITAVLHYGFKIMNLHSIEANVNPLNEPSIKLLEKNGFVREAYFKENYYYNGRFIDSAIYSLLAAQ
jgi:[ribosomal protein S5]-alanine N-acetyltransferase